MAVTSTTVIANPLASDKGGYTATVTDCESGEREKAHNAVRIPTDCENGEREKVHNAVRIPTDPLKQQTKDNKMIYSDGDKGTIFCGFGSWRPDFLQAFNRPSVFLVLFSLCGMAMVMIMGMNQIVMPMLQSLFNLSSTQMGWIIVSNDVSGIVFALLLGNFCSSHKIRWVTIGIIVSIISGFIQTAPHLFAQLPEYVEQSNTTSQTTPDTCNIVDVTTAGGATDHASQSRFYAFENNKLFWLFVVGGLAQGIGNSPPGIAGVTYLDEILTKRKIGPALAFTTFMATIGIPLSYLMGAEFLKIYATLGTPEAGVTRGSPYWVGAWWLGFLVPTLLLALFGLPLALFPIQPVYAKKVLQKKASEGLTSEEEKSVEITRSFKELIKDMLPTFRRLMSNKSYVFLVIGDSLFYLFLGSTAYDPKMRAIAYQLSISEAGTLLGIVRIVTLALGLCIGAAITAKIDLSGKRCVFVIMIVSVVTVPSQFVQLYYCTPDQMYGVDVPYYNVSTTAGLDSGCNTACNCDTSFYQPVCDTATLTTFFSPCHAGCADSFTDTDTGVKHYTNCTCLPGAAPTVRTGKCAGAQGECQNKLWVFIAVVGVSLVIFFAGFPAMNIAYLRIVNEIDRTAAQGFRQFMTRICGTLPGPILFGYIIDKHCSVWRENNGNRGNCWVYDVEGLIVTYTSVQIVIRTLCALCYIISWRLYPEKYTDVGGADLQDDNTSDMKLDKMGLK